VQNYTYILAHKNIVQANDGNALDAAASHHRPNNILTNAV